MSRTPLTANRSIRQPIAWWDALYEAAEARGTNPTALMREAVNRLITPDIPPDPAPAPRPPAPRAPRFLHLLRAK